MKILLAKTAGFCFGVNRAVNMVYSLIDEGKKVCTLGPIIHNSQMVAELEEKGVRTVKKVDEASDNEVLVIRSHGVPACVYESLSERGITVADATCPFVAKIHKIVSEYDDENDVILVAGDASHEEVKGIVGHIKVPYFVFGNENELKNILENNDNFRQKRVIAVSQTTFHAKIWGECQKILKKVCTNLNVFDTICNATSMRQQEAEGLAKECDGMIVIGGRHSSNTAKLFAVCSAHCLKTVLVETAREIDKSFFEGCERVGVVAGASTPAGIIKEVIKTMSENLQPVSELEETPVQKTFEEMTDEEAFEASLSGLTGDQKVCGVVLAVSPSEIQVDIGRGLAGYVSANEYSYDNVNLMDEVKVGDKLNLIIMKINDQEGTAMLSKRRYDSIAGWDKVVAAKESGEILTGTVKDIIKGGVVAYTGSTRVFIPASQATASRNDSLEDLKNTEVQFRIIEIGRGRRPVGSIRSVLREQRKAAQAKLWESIGVGDVFTGTVKSLTSYGAFVDIGGVDGMVHVSELSWQRIKNPAEVVSVGDTIEVYVKAIDTEKKKISLGYKKADENPWVLFNNQYAIGDTATVTIVSMTTYGAFARIIPGVDGLIHISQIANKHVAKPQDELSIGQEVEAKIIAIDDEKKRVSLSIRELLPVEEVAEETAEETVMVFEAPAEEAVAPEVTAEEVTKEAAETADAE